MKSYFLIVIFSFVSLAIKGQELKCCDSVNDVQQYLSGVWKVEDSDSKISYEYKFDSDGQGELNESEEIGNVIIDDHYFVTIVKTANGFLLTYLYLNGLFTSELEYLNSKKMILITKRTKVEYVKVSN